MKTLSLSLLVGVLYGLTVYLCTLLGRRLEAHDNQKAWDEVAALNLQAKATAEHAATVQLMEDLQHAYLAGRGEGYDLALRLQKGQFRTGSGPSNVVDWAAVSHYENARRLAYLSEVMTARLRTNGSFIAITNLTNSASMP